MGPLQQMGLWLWWLSLWLCEAVAIILILSFSVSSLYLPPKIKRFDSSRWGGGSDGHLYDFAKRQSGSLSKKFDPSRWLLVLVLLFLLPSRLCCCFCYCCPKSLIPPDGTLALMATFKTLLPTKGSTPRGGAAALTAIFMTLLRSRWCLLYHRLTTLVILSEEPRNSLQDPILRKIM